MANVLSGGLIQKASRWIVLLLVLVACREQKEISPAAEVISEAPVSAPPRDPSDSLFCRYERTPCFGRCPVFELAIYQSGYAVSEGKNFVDLIGFYHTTLSAASLQKISAVATEIGYFGFQEVYDNAYVTDLPTIYTELRFSGQRHRVMARYQAPKELQRLYTVLDEEIAQATWSLMKKNQ
jgi:hypothetical protein